MEFNFTVTFTMGVITLAFPQTIMQNDGVPMIITHTEGYGYTLKATAAERHINSDLEPDGGDPRFRAALNAGHE